jgi:hypothetical protein
VIGRVRESLGHVDVHAADRVDHLDEAVEVQAGVVVDRDAEQRADRVLERPHAAVREAVAMGVGVAEQRIQLGAERITGAERCVDQVARHR